MLLPVPGQDPDLVARRREELLALLREDGVQLIRVVCQGCSYKEAAQRMHLSLSRIEALRKRLARELDIHRQVDMVIFGFCWALVQLPVQLPQGREQAA